MTERYTSKHNLRTHEGAPLINGAQVDVMGANGGTFERPPTRAELLRLDIGKAAANSFVMRQDRLLRPGSHPEPLVRVDMPEERAVA